MSDINPIVKLSLSKSELSKLINITNHTISLLKEDDQISSAIQQYNIIVKLHKQFKAQFPNKHLPEPTI